MFLLKPSAIRHELWVEIEPYLLYVAIGVFIFYIIHLLISYFIFKIAAKKGALDAIKEYEVRKKI